MQEQEFLMLDPSQSRKPVFSEFCNDPDMRELVELFAGEMPGKVAVFENALAAGRWDDLRRLAHQLKGAAGGYGFGSVGEAAGRIEQRLIALPADSANASALDDVKRDIENLLEMCRSVRARP